VPSRLADPRLGNPLLGACACATAFVVLVLGAYFVAPVQHADAVALNDMRVLGLEHATLEWRAHQLVHLSDPLPVAAMLGLIACAGLAWNRPRHVIAAVSMVAAANVAAQLLKVILAHPRYQSVLGPVHLPWEALPSGHATAAMSLGLAAVLVAPRAWRSVVALGAVAYTLAGSASLVVLGWHFPSDVVAGFLVAVGCSLLALACLRAAEPRFGIDREGASGRRLARGGAELAAGLALAAATLLVVLGPEGLSFLTANTTAVAAGLGIALASTVLLAGVVAEAGNR